MKTLILKVLFISLAINVYAQIPQGFNYQAVIRNSSGELVTDQSISIQLSIIDNSADGEVLYAETYDKNTNAYGVVDVVVGGGTVVAGVFSEINWGVNNKYLKVEVNTGGGFSDLGTVQLLSVPFSLYANKAAQIDEEVLYFTDTDTLFAVKDRSGNIVFAVFPDGAKVYVNEAVKGSVGGFAVSGRSPSKATETEILRVTPDSTRIFVNDNVKEKGSVGGFAVSGRSPSKQIGNEYLVITPDSTRIYVDQPVKGSVGGFAVSGRSPGKSSTVQFLDLTPDNYFIGHEAGSSISGGLYNTFIGYQSGKSTIDGYNNLFLGYQTGYLNESGYNNVFIGNNTGYSRLTGYDNIFIGNLAGENSSSGTHSVYIGNEAGHNMNGDDNISIGDRAGSNAYVTEYETYGTTILGVDAGRNIQGQNNTIIGTGAGSSWSGTSTGDYNVFIGSSAGAGGYTSKLGNYNVCIGYEAGFGKSGSNRLYIANNSTSSLIYGEFDNETVLISGALEATGEIISGSDISLKTNLVPFTNGLNIVKSLSSYYFDWKPEAIENYHFKDKKQIGLIAQDVEKVLPELVSESSNGYKTLDYSKFTPVLIEAIKEQQQKIDELENLNKELIARIKALEDRMK